MKTPKRIYLQIESGDYITPNDEILINDLGDATWCVDRIHKTDVEYVKREVAARLRAALVYESCTIALGEPPEPSLDTLLVETAFLADSPEPPLSPGGENEEKSET